MLDLNSFLVWLFCDLFSFLFTKSKTIEKKETLNNVGGKGCMQIWINRETHYIIVLLLRHFCPEIQATFVYLWIRTWQKRAKKWVFWEKKMVFYLIFFFFFWRRKNEPPRGERVRKTKGRFPFRLVSGRTERGNKNKKQNTQYVKKIFFFFYLTELGQDNYNKADKNGSGPSGSGGTRLVSFVSLAGIVVLAGIGIVPLLLKVLQKIWFNERWSNQWFFQITVMIATSNRSCIYIYWKQQLLLVVVIASLGKEGSYSRSSSGGTSYSKNRENSFPKK